MIIYTPQIITLCNADVRNNGVIKIFRALILRGCKLIFYIIKMAFSIDMISPAAMLV